MSWSVNSQGISSYDTRTMNEYTMTKGFFLCNSNLSFASLAASGTKANWLQGVVDGKIFPLHGVRKVEDGSKDAMKQEFEDGSEAIMRERQRGYVAYFAWTLDQQKVAMSYNQAFQYFIPYDEANNILAKSEDGIVVKPRKIGSITVEPMTIGLAGSKPLTKVTIIEADYNEWDSDGLTIQPNKGTVATRWTPGEINPITTVTITQVGTSSSNSYVADVAYKSKSDITNTGAYSIDRPITGLLAANFQSKNGSGVIVSITSVTESATVPGRYTITHTTYATGTSEVLPSITMLFASEPLAIVAA
jgi:hypothetical protein